LSFYFISIDKKKNIANYQEEIAALKTAQALVSVLNHSTQMFDKLKDIQVQRNIDENALGLVNGARADAQPEEPDPTTLL
jgi:hypothetical protein